MQGRSKKQRRAESAPEKEAISPDTTKNRVRLTRVATSLSPNCCYDLRAVVRGIVHARTDWPHLQLIPEKQSAESDRQQQLAVLDAENARPLQARSVRTLPCRIAPRFATHRREGTRIGIATNEGRWNINRARSAKRSLLRFVYGRIYTHIPAVLVVAHDRIRK
jgi:hypothetical protein